MLDTAKQDLMPFHVALLRHKAMRYIEEKTVSLVVNNGSYVVWPLGISIPRTMKLKILTILCMATHSGLACA